MIINENTSIGNMRYTLDTHLHVNILMKPIGLAAVKRTYEFIVDDVAAASAAATTDDDENLRG